MDTHHLCCWLDKHGGDDEGSYPQQIFFGSMWIVNPQFQRVVWAWRCWGWSGRGLISARSLISFNFAANSFLEENFWGGLLQQEGRKTRKWSVEKYLSWAFSLDILKKIQIAVSVPQPRLFGLFLSWCDFGADCKNESGLYGVGIPPMLICFL